jgi:hypothetical protein
MFARSVAAPRVVAARTRALSHTTAAAAAQPAAAAAASSSAAAASSSAAAAVRSSNGTELRGHQRGQTLWGPATHKLPLESFKAVPRLHRPPKAAGWTPPVPTRTLRLEHDEPNSTRVQYTLTAAAVVERWPKIMVAENAWSAQYKQHFDALRQRQALAHRIPADLQAREADEVDEHGNPVSAADAAASEADAAFAAATADIDPRLLLTEADVARDLHATHRALTESLYLIVKRRGGGAMAGWQFPTAQVPFDVLAKEEADPKALIATLQRDGAPPSAIAAAKALVVSAAKQPKKVPVTLRSVASSALTSTVGTHAAIYMLGNAPLTVLRQFKNAEAEQLARNTLDQLKREAAERAEAGFLAPPRVSDADATKSPPEIVGSKTFFMHALYMDGEVRLQNAREYEDYAWVKREELAKYVGKEQAEALAPVLLDARANQ